MAETVGFDLTITIIYSAVSVLLQLPMIVVAFLVLRVFRTALSSSTLSALATGFVLGQVMGTAFSESWILIDEHNFNSEIQNAPNSNYSRPRAWPNQQTSLVYDRDRGVHATD